MDEKSSLKKYVFSGIVVCAWEKECERERERVRGVEGDRRGRIIICLQQDNVIK